MKNESERSAEEIRELWIEAERLMVKLLPPEDFGESYDAEALYHTLEDLRDAALKAKEESLPEAIDEQIKLDLKLHGRAYYLTDDNGRKERIDPLRLITVFESKEDNKAWKDSYEEGEAG